MIAATLIACLAAAFVALLLWTRIVAARARRDYPPEGRFVPVTGGRLHLVDTGMPPGGGRGTVLLLHGASGNQRDMMLSLGRHLADEWRVIAPDRPGHGWSDRLAGRQAASPARQARAIAEALRSIGAERAIVVGHSWSGTLATALALDHAEQVAGLVLLAPVTHPWPGGVTWYYGVAVHPLAGPVFRHAVVGPVGSLTMRQAAASVFAPEPLPPAYARETGAALVLRPANFRANAEDVFDLLPHVEQQALRYGEIAVPLAVIAGDADGIVSTSIHARQIAAEVAGARLTILPGTGHMPHHTHRAEVLAAIDSVAARAAQLT